jgi:hypothetical protein
MKTTAVKIALGGALLVALRSCNKRHAGKLAPAAAGGRGITW